MFGVGRPGGCGRLHARDARKVVLEQVMRCWGWMVFVCKSTVAFRCGRYPIRLERPWLLAAVCFDVWVRPVWRAWPGPWLLGKRLCVFGVEATVGCVWPWMRVDVSEASAQYLCVAIALVVAAVVSSVRRLSRLR